MSDGEDETRANNSARRYRVKLRIVVEEIWEVEAESPSDAEFNYMTNPDAFLFDREEIESDVIEVRTVQERRIDR